MSLQVAYARERLTAGRLLPAVLLVVAAAGAGRGWTGPADLAIDAVGALGLVIAFRTWDDLADREHDRARHPGRVAVRAASTRPLTVAAVTVAAGTAGLVGLTRGSASVAALAAYAGLLAASYATRTGRSLVREWILLLKYGVFTLALMGVPAALTARGVISAAAAFAGACVYEWMHDAESPVFDFGGSR